MIIYKATNLVNGKIYIGQAGDLEARKRNRKYDALSGRKDSYFDRAIRKYGWENFVFIEIDRGGTPEVLDEKERCWINFYKSRDKNIGYNLAEGGRTSRGTKMSEEQKLKNSIAKTKYFSDPEKRKEFSERAKKQYAEGRRKPQKGVPLSEETKRKLSDVQKERYRSGKTASPLKKLTKEQRNKSKETITARYGKKVRCIETDMIYPSLEQAGRENNLDPSSIRRVAKGKGDTCGGFRWRFVDNLL